MCPSPCCFQNSPLPRAGDWDCCNLGSVCLPHSHRSGNSSRRTTIPIVRQLVKSGSRDSCIKIQSYEHYINFYELLVGICPPPSLSRHILLGQGVLTVQVPVSFAPPTQSMPLLAGAGFVHVRERLRAPVPELHVSEHAPQDPQSAQFPFTEKKVSLYM